MNRRADAVSIRELDDADRHAIARWRYEGALAIYEPRDDAHLLRAPDHVGLVVNDGALLGYGTLGPEARVPGGLYDDAQHLDLGLGLDPALVGRGYGHACMLALMAHARRERGTRCFRATVALVNPRATALVLAAGFVETHRFERDRDGRVFAQYARA